MAIDKSTWNKKIKVSQGTVNQIKQLGMTKALDLAKMNANPKNPQEGLIAEYQEATRRLYGDRRFNAATGGSASTKYSPTPYKAPKASTKYSPKPMSPATKASIKKAAAVKARAKSKGGISKNVAAGIGAAAAIGVTIASRGRAVGLATKLSPGLMRNKFAQAALTGTIKSPSVATKASTVAMKAKDAAAAASGRVTAAAGRPVSQSQYDAMVAAARAKGISTVAKKAAAKKATTTAAKKTVAKKTAAKKVAAKKTGLSAGRRWDANAPK